MLHVYILSTTYYYLCRFYSIFDYKEAHGIKFFTHHIFQRLLHKRRKREEKKGLQAPSISESFARYAENFGCGNRTVLGTIQGDVYDDNDHSSIGTPVEGACVSWTHVLIIILEQFFTSSYCKKYVGIVQIGVRLCVRPLS